MTDSSRQISKWSLWLWWVLVTAGGVAVSSSILALAFRVIALVGPVFTVLLGAGHFGYSINLLSHAIVGSIIGAGLGLAQYLVLRQRIQQAKEWVLTSAVGLAIGNMFTLPASLFAHYIVYGSNFPWPFPYFDPVGAGAVMAMTAAVAGAAMGIVQWFFLRRRTHRSGWWVLTSALAWSVGVIPGYFGGMALRNIGWVPASGGWHVLGDQFLYIWEGMGLPIVGVVVGAITGLALVILLGTRTAACEGASETVAAISTSDDR